MLFHKSQKITLITLLYVENNSKYIIYLLVANELIESQTAD